MRRTMKLCMAYLIGSASLIGPGAFSDPASVPGQPLEYTPEGRLERPMHYREWVYLTTGFASKHAHEFDNVFVEPQAYAAFLETGRWPDKTALIIENRAAVSKGSINKSGNYQGAVVGLEVHVKDRTRFAGEWAFFVFQSGAPAAIIPRSAACYSCHSAHGAVDTTFVQFYPTLLPIAQSKGTLSHPLNCR